MAIRNTKFHYDPSFPAAETRLTMLSGRDYAPHYHREFSVGAVLEGRVRVEWSGGAVSAGPGELVVVDPMTVHSCNTVEGRPRSYCMTYLDADYCSRLLPAGAELGRDGRLDLIGDPALFMEAVDLNALLTAPEAGPDEKEAALRRFLPRLAAGRPPAPETASAPSCEGTADSAPAPADGSAVAAASSAADAAAGAVAEAAKRIAERAYDGITLDELGEELGLSKYYLLRLFKSRTALPPHRYLVNHRINEAKRLLKRFSIAETAAALGFCDQSHFTRAFTALTACGPAEYRAGGAGGAGAAGACGAGAEARS